MTAYLLLLTMMTLNHQDFWSQHPFFPLITSLFILHSSPVTGWCTVPSTPVLPSRIPSELPSAPLATPVQAPSRSPIARTPSLPLPRCPRFPRIFSCHLRSLLQTNEVLKLHPASPSWREWSHACGYRHQAVPEFPQNYLGFPKFSRNLGSNGAWETPAIGDWGSG